MLRVPESLLGLVGWLVNLVGWLISFTFYLYNSWTPVPSAVELSLQIFKQTQKLTFTVNKFILLECNQIHKSCLL